MTKVTIITVCYNAAATLARTMQSVLEQTHAVAQYLVIDGASTDGTLAIAQSFQDKFGQRLQIVSEADSGIYDAMNKGIARATGDVIGILNADDWYERDAVDHVVAMAAQPGVYYGMVKKWHGARERVVVREHHQFLPQDNIPHPATFVSRAVYQQHGAFDLRYKLAADYELLLRFYRKNVHFQPIDRILTNFAVGGASLRQARRMWIETIDIRRRYGSLSAAKYWIFRLLIEARAFVETYVLKERLFMMQKVALITGITGQDGFYLTELLLQKGYVVHGLQRRGSLIKTDRLLPLLSNPSLHLHYGDMTDTSNLTRVLAETQPDEVYNLAAQSHVKVSFDVPEYTANADGIGALRILEAIRTLGLTKKTRFYQASTSELYGLVQEVPQRETTPFYPRSPYAVAKMYAYWITVNYREAYGMYACNGILFNHESPLRGETFVTRKITRAVAAIHNGHQDTLFLGNMDAKRDWGHARDYVDGMWRMLQQDVAEDFVLATGETQTVRSFVEKAFQCVGVELDWQGAAEAEKGLCKKSGKTMVAVDPQFYRPTEVELLLGDPSKAKAKLGWSATTTLDQLVREMMDADLAAMGGAQALLSKAA